MCELELGANHIFSKGKFQGSGLAGKNFQKESKSCPNEEKEISGNKGKRPATLQVPCGCSTAILYSRSLCASTAELGKEKGVRKQQALLSGSPVNLPPTTCRCRSNKTRASCSIPALQTGAESLQFWAESVPELTEICL